MPILREQLIKAIESYLAVVEKVAAEAAELRRLREERERQMLQSPSPGSTSSQGGGASPSGQPPSS